MAKKFSISEAVIVLKEGKKLYSDIPVQDITDVVRLIGGEIRHTDREHMIVINLDAMYRPVNYHLVAIGGLVSVEADIANVFKTAILSNAKGIILVHNHPMSDMEPSEDDIAVTEQVSAAGNILGITLVDHIIIGEDGRVFSFAENTDLLAEEN